MLPGADQPMAFLFFKSTDSSSNTLDYCFNAGILKDMLLKDMLNFVLAL